MTHADVYSSDRIVSIWSFALPNRLVGNYWRHRQLLRQFTWREVEGRYRGSHLGLLWALIYPLLMLAVYTFVFSQLLGQRWPDPRNPVASGGGFMDYALAMFSGLIAFNLFAECATGASGLITRNPNFVKKVVFPLELLPASLVGSAFIHSLLSLSIILLAVIVTGDGPHLTWLALPLLYVPLLTLSLGVSLILSSLGVFMRDIGNLMVVGTQLLMFLTPIFYPPSVIDNVPRVYQVLYHLNPFVTLVDGFRKAVLWGQWPDWGGLALVTLASGAVLLVGYMWFMKIKRAFADVI